MNRIKQLREQLGHTQASLAAETGLSLRTIQRMEAAHKLPKGNSLVAISKAFNINPIDLQTDHQSNTEDTVQEKLDLMLINLSVLAFFIFPFGNIILPFIVWRKKRKRKKVDRIGRRIINFQILWSIVLCISLSVAPFIDNGGFSTPLIFVFLIVLMVLNFAVIVRTADKIRNDESGILDLAIRLL